MEPETVDIMEKVIYPAIGALIAWLYVKFFAGSAGTVKKANLPPAIERWYYPAKSAASKYNVPLPIILAVIWQESRGNAEANGLDGEIGLMQLKQIAVTDLVQNGYKVPAAPSSNPSENIMQGTAFLALQKKRAGTWFNTLWAYNQGYQGMLNGRLAGRSYAESVMSKASEWGYNG